MKNHLLSLKAQKKVKDIKGFYTHVFSTFIILPFIILINLKTVPNFYWFYYVVIAWFIGLLIHWLNVFILSKNSFKKDWEEKKLKEILGIESIEKEIVKDEKFIQEHYFIKAKKKAKEIKGFYIHLLVELGSLAIIIFINLKFVPRFHFFWFALGGMSIALFFHWLGVFGFDFLGLGENWEKKKIEELIKSYT